MDAAPHDSPRTCGVFVTIHMTFFVTLQDREEYPSAYASIVHLGKELARGYSFNLKLTPCAKRSLEFAAPTL